MTSYGMFQLSPEHEMIRQAARDFAQKEIAPIAAEFDETGEFPSNTIKKMGEMGFMGIEVPEEYGGAGIDTLAYVLALEEICKADASHGTIMSVNNSLFCHGLLKYGSEEMKKKYVYAVASGEAIGAYSLTEPMSGSDAGTMRSRAVRQGDEYVINGRKSWVTSGPVADYVVLFTLTDPEKKQRGITAFLIEASKPGFVRGRTEPKLGIRASATSESSSIFRVPQKTDCRKARFKIAMTVLTRAGSGSRRRRWGSPRRLTSPAWPTPASGRPSGRRSASSRGSPSSWPT
jgi:alkylation response protein AidB-like acyl-CoA dehydrogenase